MTAKLDFRGRLKQHYDESSRVKKFLWGLLLYLSNVLFLVNLMVNTVLGGTPQEHLSSRVGKWIIYPEEHMKIFQWLGRILAKSRVLYNHFTGEMSGREGKLTGRDLGLF